jgi:hypothetical protein
MKKLILKGNTYEGEHDFRVEGIRGNVALFQGMEKEDDGIYWGLQRASVLKAYYSESDKAYSQRMRVMEPIKNGEVVEINGDQYRTIVIGNYSNCVQFEKVGAE